MRSVTIQPFAGVGGWVTSRGPSKSSAVDPRINIEPPLGSSSTSVLSPLHHHLVSDESYSRFVSAS